MLFGIEEKIDWNEKTLQSVDCMVGDVSPQEFYDNMAGEIFSEDKADNRRTIADSPKTIIYDARAHVLYKFDKDIVLQESSSFLRLVEFWLNCHLHGFLVDLRQKDWLLASSEAFFSLLHVSQNVSFYNT